jgi:hypothetical protein
MAQPILSSDNQTLDEGVGHALRQGEQAGTITDGMVNASATNAALRALVTAGGVADSTDELPYRQLVNRALTIGFNTGSCSDVNVNAATTVALLVANTYSQPGKIGIMGEFI